MATTKGSERARIDRINAEIARIKAKYSGKATLGASQTNMVGDLFGTGNSAGGNTLPDLRVAPSGTDPQRCSALMDSNSYSQHQCKWYKPSSYKATNTGKKICMYDKFDGYMCDKCVDMHGIGRN